MSLTIELVGDSRVRLDDVEVTARSEADLAFRVEGTLRLTQALLSEFAGRRLTPDTVAFSVDDAEVVEVALEDGTSLRLETVDVGVETPDGELDGDVVTADTDAVSPDPADARSLASDVAKSLASTPSALAFTVEGVVENVAADDFEALSADEVVPASVTFSVDETPETDGGAPDDALFELHVFGFEIAIWENGTILLGRPTDDSTSVV